VRAKARGQGKKGRGVHAKAGLPNASFPKVQRHRHSHFFCAIPRFTLPCLRGNCTGSSLPQGPSLHARLSPPFLVSDLVICSGLSNPTRPYVPAKHHQNRGSECCHGCVRCFRDCFWCGFFNSFLSMFFCMCPGFVDRGICDSSVCVEI
jgi:hypothetical protein